MNKQERKSYRINRNLGACEVCKRRKKRCNRECAPYIQCLNSKSLVFLDKPESCKLFRSRKFRIGPKHNRMCLHSFPGPSTGHPLDSAHKGIYSLSEIVMPGSATVKLHITQGMSRKMAVYVGQFAATPEYKTRHVWSCADGLKKLDLPPFCLAHMDQMKRSVCDYIQNSWCSYLENITIRSDPIACEILLEAQRHSSSDKVWLLPRTFL